MAITPGNWTYNNEGVITSDSGISVAVVLWDTRISLNEGNANLKMMAAAPKMLDALYWAKGFGKNGGVHDKMIMHKILESIEIAETK